MFAEDNGQLKPKNKTNNHQQNHNNGVLGKKSANWLISIPFGLDEMAIFFAPNYVHNFGTQ